MPTWSLSESAVCPGQKLSWEKEGPLCSSPYTVLHHPLLKCHRDRGHPSPWHHGESSGQLLLGRAGFGCPPTKEPSLLPSDIHKAHLPAPWARPAVLPAAFPSCRAGSGAGLQDRSFSLTHPPRPSPINPACWFIRTSGRALPRSSSLSVFIFYAHLWGTVQI